MPAANALSDCWVCRKRGYLFARPFLLKLGTHFVERRVRAHGECSAMMRTMPLRRDYWKRSLRRLRYLRGLQQP